MRRALLPAALALAVPLALAQPAGAAPTTPAGGGGGDPLADLRLEEPVRGTLDPDLPAEGRTTVNVVLAGEAVGEVAARGAGAQAQRERGRQVAAEQRDVLRAVRAADPRAQEVASATTAINSVVVEADVTALAELAEDPRVVSVSVVRHYEMDLAETVPYIGARAVQERGFDGTGTTVAVLDSGVDFTHAAFGGPGTVELYEQCYGIGPTASGQPFDAAPVGECAEFFGPGAKVVGGMDFVGEVWPNGERYTDPNPIDYEGHGTHVADIIAGEQGVAPGAAIQAVKVCSAVASSCNGVALLLAMDYVLDPDGDGVTTDKVDVVNMSLGSVYGQAFDDDLAFAVDVATANGVLTVASAGNSSDKPFVTGTPAAAPSALSVAQTDVPSSTLQLLDVGEGDSARQVPAVFQPWSAPVTSTVTGTLQYGDGAGGNLLGCAPFAPGSLEGLVVLVDRGECNFTLKAANVAQAGGTATLIGLVTPELPFTGANGGDPGADLRPAFMIGQADNAALKQRTGQPVTIDPDNTFSTVGTVTGSSSRGPSMNGQLLKPEIGAPGASVSAVAGSGDGTEAFGGTSGAAPMVSGAAALLMQARPGRLPAEYKAVLMNTAETDVLNLPGVIGGQLAPVSRIGGGEVRADAAVASDLAAWTGDGASGLASGGISFGHVEVSAPTTLTRTVTVANYGTGATVLAPEARFRFAADADAGAVRVQVPARVRVPAGGTASFDVRLRIDPAGLPEWALDSGALGASGDALTAMEVDGYLHLRGSTGEVHLPWHVLPRRASSVELRSPGNPALQNTGRTSAPLELFDLLGTSPEQPSGGPGEEDPRPDLRAAGIASVTDGCGAGDAVLAFAATTWERQTHAIAPASVRFFVDTDRDGTDDHLVYTQGLDGAFADGRVVTFVADLATGQASAFFFVDHDTVSANTVLYACASQLGLAGADPGTSVDVTATVADTYFQGVYTDEIATATVQPLAVPLRSTQLAPNQRVRVEDGTLVLVRQGAPDGREAFVVE